MTRFEHACWSVGRHLILIGMLLLFYRVGTGEF
jgi:hypothetical protein